MFNSESVVQKVVFGNNQAADVDVKSATTLTASVPEGSYNRTGRTSISVYTAGGNASAAKSFTIEPSANNVAVNGSAKKRRRHLQNS